ncbi:MAG: hypothetical protein NTW86_03785 [Candidatus Sumerlaeota bacterium]|nr:hypothetical protein [Candidatus Sumerlaeota bacterium]
MKGPLQFPNLADPVETADFVEQIALCEGDGSISQMDVLRRLAPILEPEGEESEFHADTRQETEVLEAFDELRERQSHMGAWSEHYPFVLAGDGDLLSLKASRRSEEKSLLYVFLLLATRMNMKEEPRQRTAARKILDATKLFELVCLEVAQSYLGGGNDNRVVGFLLGTSRLRRQHEASKKKSAANVLGRFPKAIDSLCGAWGEGERFENQGSAPVVAQDDGVDIVVWRTFADGREGRLTGFGQCKTGTSWQTTACAISPDRFCQRWMKRMPAVSPVPLYFVADRVVERWYNRSSELGILFDRCRILDYAECVSSEILRDCAAWTLAALEKHGLNW